mgnify:CR=1 FL=1|jgi:hypothetical protein
MAWEPVNEASAGNGELEVRLYRSRDYAAVSSLFTAIFNQPMTPAFHAWKYRPGRSAAMVVFKNGELVAHYGGVGNAIVMCGEDSTAMQIVDVMVKPSARQAVRKTSPFFIAGSTFLEQFIGNSQPWLLGYGFPSDRHMRLAAHLGLYAPVGRMVELVWDSAALASEPKPWWQIDTLSTMNASTYNKPLDALWAAMRKDLDQACAVVKDAEWLRWRYLEHPEREYQVRLVRNRWTGRALGLFVCRPEGERLFLLDLVGPRAHLPLLLGLAAREAQQQKLQSLMTWCSKGLLDWLPHDSAVVTELPITTPANVWTPGPAPESLQDRWWLLPGDTDFL